MQQRSMLSTTKHYLVVHRIRAPSLMLAELASHSLVVSIISSWEAFYNVKLFMIL
jgi:hypothetical protein